MVTFVLRLILPYLWFYISRSKIGTFGDITKTRLYNIDPVKPHFCIVKLGFTGVYIIFLISAQKHRLWVLCFEQKYEKYQFFFYLKIFRFFGMKFSIYLNRRVFVMIKQR